MYRVFEKSGKAFAFTPESVTDSNKFLLELAGQLHQSADAVASGLLEKETDDDGVVSFLWREKTGKESQLLDSLQPQRLLKQCLIEAVEKGVETCLLHNRSDGLIRPIRESSQKQQQDGVPHANAAGKGVATTGGSTENGDGTGNVVEAHSVEKTEANQPLKADPPALKPKPEPELPGEVDSAQVVSPTMQQPQVEVLDSNSTRPKELSSLLDPGKSFSFSSKLPTYDVEITSSISAASVLAGDEVTVPGLSGSPQQAEPTAAVPSSTPAPVLEPKSLRSFDSVVWIRPLTKSHVIISICPRKAVSYSLKYVIRNAHEAREANFQRLQAGQKFEDSRKVLRFAEGVTEKLPFNEQAYLQANEIRRYLECDRVTIFDINNSSARALAVSGQPKFNVRANSIRAGQNLVGRAAKTGEPFWFSGNFDDLADSLKNLVRQYTDESLVNSFAVLPLIETNKPVYPSEEETMQEAISPGSASQHKTIGAVLVEQIENVVERSEIQERWENIHPVVLNQYKNSRMYDSIFLVRAWTMLGRFASLYRGQTQRKAIAITAAIAAVVLGSLIIPSDFKIRSEGYLAFDNTMDLYTKGEGSVVELNVFDGKQVQRGDVLLVQENLEIARQRAQIAGELAQKRAEIGDLNDSRSRSYFTVESGDSQRTSELAQRVVQLEVEVSELELQFKMIENEAKQLSISAPFDGTIAGWKTERRLLGRPLQKGTHLFSLIPKDASLKLELCVPDQRAGYVQTAWHRSQAEGEKLPVVFRLASAPGENRKATVSFVSPALERDEHIGYSLPIYAVTEDEIPDSERRSRTAVLAKIICGRRSFAYCKCYEALDWFRSKCFELSF